ncbi:hypothetical protein TCAL_03810 [Tigriopus californicus]|uniref:Ubiquitin-like modifier-activating enzyme ATG7 n=1 Tax=Tigriopus californicus TaxID=6832 RepID=A0A553NVR7_TIGCA|nr:ubiquitin-like modifier-activating enzyme ATG7 [Tigriopus californicus]TRY69526.1 hypothetical protein TCAL_03810 [Tigriopus californicus]|eukprot:TCALIF_03810-PA protein Name:"Similar to ATG7 Ubiquitin-like modifier-activating enzyme ATG7 (Gallus gallus)" AED:0.03 eAED:0.03 QI:1089/1/0.8/1/0.75/0.8/5/0/686
MVFQVMPFTSALHSAFWPLISNKKLTELRLDESPLPALAKYANNNKEGVPATLCLEWDAFDPKLLLQSATFLAKGSVVNTNTIETFKTMDKKEFLAQEADTLWKLMLNGEAIQEPSRLCSWVLLMHADLKKYLYYYWFAFPSFELPGTLEQKANPKAVESELRLELCEHLLKSFEDWKRLNSEISGFFFVRIEESTSVKILSLAEGIKPGVKFDYIGLADPSSMDEHPGVPLRNLLTLLMIQCPEKLLGDFKVLCLRQIRHGSNPIGKSVVLSMSYSGEKLANQPRSFGWESDESGRMLPRCVNMKSSMDPQSLAESALDLNLKLMKWRLVPDLDLDLIKNTKCLLLGAGTLGCNVARCLLGWGVRSISFVDCAKVSYSNPVRQSLFTFEDCLAGSDKAKAAAHMMKKIFPGCKSAHYNLRVPMPGHAISEALEKGVLDDFNLLDRIVQEHDVIFLLMDSRESRWLPTVMGATYKKIVINAALGLDSFVVMRHGTRDSRSFQDPNAKANAFLGGKDVTYVPGHDLGCYFCTDIVAPGNSTADRTLDQQCTVTRPGVSYQAAALAVELLSSLLQHPKKAEAPAAVYSKSYQGGDSLESTGILGVVPHTIRGSLQNFQQFTPTSMLFPKCSACSEKVIEAFKDKKFDFLKRAAADKKYLEDLVGLTEMLNVEGLEEDVFTLDDDDLTD